MAKLTKKAAAQLREHLSGQPAERLIGHIAELLRTAGREADVDEYLADVRQRHKPKTKLLGFLADDFPAGHPYHDVHAVPGLWQADMNRVPRPTTAPQAWILGSSPYSARLAAHLGRPYAFALQFGDADIETALRIYRQEFRPSPALEQPHTLVSVGVVAHDQVDEAERQARIAAMAMLRMFRRESYSLLPAEEVLAFEGTVREQQILDLYSRLFRNGTGADVADALEQLHERVRMDEVMLVTMGSSRDVHARTIELVADHYSMAPTAS